MKHTMLLWGVLLLGISNIKAQVILEANGAGNTYELINSVLAPGYDAIEAPDCSHESFGRHIDEVFDQDLNKNVFRFFIHATPDNDRCIKMDRQRNEIKTYDQSPDNLKAVENEEVEYKWKFKIDASFQASSSFTHLHQLKAVGGSEESMPLITLTARKGNPDKLELRYAENTSQETLTKIELTDFKGSWVEVTETVKYGESTVGEYKIKITRISDGNVLLDFSQTNIRMWKTDAEFIRPKWGIYRSLNNAADLRDEEVLFADFTITELQTQDIISSVEAVEAARLFPNPFQEKISISDKLRTDAKYVYIYNQAGRLVCSKIIASSTLVLPELAEGLYFFDFYSDEKYLQTVKVIKQ